jgi:hypothetical protein
MATPAPKASLASRAARDPALLKRALANPGLRYKLPSSMLSVAQKRARTNAQAAKASAQSAAALSDPTTPLSGPNLIAAAHTTANGLHDPTLAELARQTVAAKAQGQQAQRATGSIYDTINKYQTAALTQQNQQQAAGAQNVAGIYTGAAGQVDAAAEQQRAQAAKDAQVRGTGLDGGSLADLASRVTTAKDNIAQRGQIAGDNLAANAQTNNAVLGGIGAATQQHGGEQRDAIGNQTRASLADLAGKRSVEEGNKGADFVKQLLGLRQQATNEYITEAGLNLKGATAAQASQDKAAQRQATAKNAAAGRATTTANQAANRKAQEKKWGRTVNKYGVTNAAWYQWGKTDAGKQKRADAMAKAKTSGKGAAGKSPFLAPAAQVSAKDTIDTAAGLISQYRKTHKYTDSQIRQVLTSGVPADKKTGQVAIKPVPKDLLNAAMDVAVNGYLSPANVKALHNRGIKVKRLGYPTSPSPSSVANQVDNAIPGRLIGG